MAVSVTYSAAKGLTQTHVTDSDDAVFEIQDVALTGQVQAVAAVTAAAVVAATAEAPELNAFGTSVLTLAAGAAAADMSMSDGSSAGQIKTIIVASHDGNAQVITLAGPGGAADEYTLGGNAGTVQLIWTGSQWAELLDTNTVGTF